MSGFFSNFWLYWIGGASIAVADMSNEDLSVEIERIRDRQVEEWDVLVLAEAQNRLELAPENKNLHNRRN